MKRFWIVVAAAALTACSGSSRDKGIAREVERSILEADWRAKETRTISALARLEEALDAYIKTERAIPETLELLVPKYLGEIPTVELEIRGHRDVAQVELYDRRILRDGQIDGSQLRDTGRWGYVYNDRQVVVFVDCTHQSRRKTPWYQHHGL